MAAGATVAGIAVARHDRQAAVVVSPSPSPVVLLDEETACRRMIPLLTESAAEMNGILANPGGPTAPIAATTEGLRTLEPMAPEAWRDDIATQHRSLQQLVDAHGDHGKIAAINFDAFADSGQRLAHGCLPYVVS